MSYTALYRKFRPAEFEEVRGQEHIVTTLKNQIAADRIGHAYLFCGTRGTGKTTVAKIFAKAVNCEHPVDGSPCGECRMCRAIAAGTSMNVIEIDAASNNGVDNIREIREEVAYSPAEGRYKVYIIDEVHMLSIGAFNALLKTLEEPPSYVIFILATTEAHKIPVTILSRCQRYDFHRISADTIAARLQELVEREHVEAEEWALRYIAKAADGSMRDALSLLDQCIAFYLGRKLTYDNVLDVCGAVDTEVFSDFLRKILERDIAGCIRGLEQMILQGRELGQFVTDFAWYLRNLLLVKSSGDAGEMLDVSAESLRKLKEEAALVEFPALMRYIRVFSELSGQIRYASQKRVLVELAVIKLCRPAMEQSLEAVLERLSDMERRLEEGVSPGKVQPVQERPKAVREPEAPRRPEPKAIPEDVKRAVAEWKSIIRETSVMTRSYLKYARLSLGGDNRLQVVLEDGTAYEFLNREHQRQELEEAIARKIGRRVEVDVRYAGEGENPEDSYVDLSKIIHMDVTIEE